MRQVIAGAMRSRGHSLISRAYRRSFTRASELQGLLQGLAKLGEQHEPRRMAKAFRKHEIPDLKRCVAIIDPWLDHFITNVED
jgi:hypothetical protein